MYFFYFFIIIINYYKLESLLNRINVRPFMLCYVFPINITINILYNIIIL